MIKFHKLPEDILEHIPDVKSYLEGCRDVVFAYLFGGLAKGKPAPLSDVDIALYLSSEADFSKSKMEILGRLIDILATDEIDLVILNLAPLPFRARTICNKLILVDKDPFLRHKFESLTLREYFDFSVKERDIFSGRYSLGR